MNSISKAVLLFAVTAVMICSVVVTDVSDADPQDMEEMTVSGITGSDGTVFSSEQRVVVDGSWTLTAGADITVQGMLVVPETSTLTIEDGAVLTLDNDAEDYIVADIRGMLIIEESETERIQFQLSDGTMEVSGAVSVDGVMHLYGGTETIIRNGASLTVEENGFLTATGVMVSEDAVLTVRGVLHADNTDQTVGTHSGIFNHGTVIFDSHVASMGIFISMMGDGAVVDIINLTFIDLDNSILQVSDDDYVVTQGKDEYHLGAVNAVRVMVDWETRFSGTVSGLRITERASIVSGESDEGEYISEIDKTCIRTMELSGSVTVSARDSDGGSEEGVSVWMTSRSDDLSISDLTLGSGVHLATGHRHVTVSGDLDATAEGCGLSMAGTVDVVGEGMISLAGTLDCNVNGAMYETVRDSSKLSHYVTVDVAVALLGIIDEITLLGENSLSSDAAIPSGSTVRLSDGSVLTVDNGLIIAEGADVRGSGSIIVDGTLHAQCRSDMTSTIRSNIVSDVYSEEGTRGGWAEWTNLADALSDAGAKDIEILRDVNVAENLRVPSAAILTVPEGLSLILSNGVTLTIDGTLRCYGNIIAENRFSTAAYSVDDDLSRQSSTIVVNGFLVTPDEIPYCSPASGSMQPLSGGAPLAGAYYLTSDGYMVSTLAGALSSVEGITGDIKLRGEVDAGDVSFTATEDCTRIVVCEFDFRVTDMSGDVIPSSLTADSITLSGSSLVLEWEGMMFGDIIVGDAVLRIDSATGGTISDDDGLVISGRLYAIHEGSVTLVSGNAMLLEGTEVGDLTVDRGAELGGSGYVGTLIVEGTLSIGSSDEMLVNILSVQNGGSVVVSEGSGTEVPGSLVVALAVIGCGFDDFKLSYASVTGPMFAYRVAVGMYATVVDADFPEKYTEFDAEGHFLTVYSRTDDLFIVQYEVPLEDVWFDGTWLDADGNDVTGQPIGSVDRVYAKLDYDVYHVVLLANEGIDDVTIGGNLMSKGLVEVDGNYVQAYTATISAGTYRVEYTLANGYSGEARLYVDGIRQAGNNLEVSGTPEGPEGITVIAQLSGVTSSGLVDTDPSVPSDPTVKVEQEDGMTVTDWLLIVLVILVAVLTVLVAMRMLRS